jgi:hypothetical protein
MLVPPLALRIGQGRFVVRIREIRLQGRLLQQTRRLLFARRLHGSSARGKDRLERDQRVWGAVHSRKTGGAPPI